MTAYRKILTAPLRISILVLIAGILMKTTAMPFASTVLLVSFFSISILYGIRFYKKEKKQFIDYVKLVLVIFWMLTGIFRTLDFSYTIFFQITAALAFVIWTVMEGTAYFLDYDLRSKNSGSYILWNMIMVVGTLLLIIGGFLKVLNGAYAIPLILVGIVLISAYIFKDILFSTSIEGDDNGNDDFRIIE